MGPAYYGCGVFKKKNGSNYHHAIIEIAERWFIYLLMISKDWLSLFRPFFLSLFLALSLFMCVSENNRD